MGGKRSPGKPKAPSMMRRNQPTQGKKAVKTPVKVKRLPVARKLSQEEELDLEDELSLDTIKETNQEQSRTNTHRGNLGNGA